MDTTIAETRQLWPWLIPGLPLMGALLTGAMHLASLRRPKSEDKTTNAPLASNIAILVMAAAFAFSIKGFLALRGGEENILSTSYDWIPTGDFTVSW